MRHVCCLSDTHDTHGLISSTLFYKMDYSISKKNPHPFLLELNESIRAYKHVIIMCICRVTSHHVRNIDNNREIVCGATAATEDMARTSYVNTVQSKHKLMYINISISSVPWLCGSIRYDYNQRSSNSNNILCVFRYRQKYSSTQQSKVEVYLCSTNKTNSRKSFYLSNKK